jgi:hypothetical protein
MIRKIALYAVAAALIISMTACGNTKVTTPTSQSPIGDTPAVVSNALSISSTNAFTDSYGRYHVVGAVINNSNEALSSIELSVEIKDASGNSLLKDDSGNVAPNVKISPMLYTLAPGQSSPFDYSYETSQGTPASYNVTITGQQPGTSNPANLKTENVQLVDDGSGWYYLTGELVNTGSQWAHVNGLAGAVLDDSGKLLSGDWSATFTTELAPAGDTSGRDRTPFEINFPNPGGATKWQVYLDADVTTSVTDYPLSITVSNSYFDQYGSFHVVGWVTNNDDQPLDSLVVAGLYGADKTVLDSSYAFLPIPVKPGAQSPFSVSSFSSINYNPDQAALVSTWSVQADPWFTYPPTNELVDLTATGETVTKNGATWTVDGSVSNSSNKNLSGITVVVMIKDKMNNLVAMEYTSISPTTEFIAAGETNPYSVSIYLDPAADATAFTTTTLIVGDVK